MKSKTTISICIFSLAICSAMGASCPTGTGSGTTMGATGYNCEKTSAYYPIIGATFYTCTKCNSSNAYLLEHKSTYGNCDISYYTCECNYGYFGTQGNCSQCPEYETGKRGSVAAGARTITECYIPGGTGFSDNTGSGTYTDKCFYKN